MGIAAQSAAAPNSASFVVSCAAASPARPTISAITVPSTPGQVGYRTASWQVIKEAGTRKDSARLSYVVNAVERARTALERARAALERARAVVERARAVVERARAVFKRLPVSLERDGQRCIEARWAAAESSERVQRRSTAMRARSTAARACSTTARLRMRTARAGWSAMDVGENRRPDALARS